MHDSQSLHTYCIFIFSFHNSYFCGLLLKFQRWAYQQTANKNKIKNQHINYGKGYFFMILLQTHGVYKTSPQLHSE